jgi:hypothetical protein
LDGNPEGWKFYNDAFIFDLGQLTWTQLKCKGDPPHGRVGHRSVACARSRVLWLERPNLMRLSFDRSVVVDRKLWIFGGTYMDNDFTYHYFADVWTLDLGMDRPTLPPRLAFAISTDPTSHDHLHGDTGGDRYA